MTKAVLGLGVAGVLTFSTLTSAWAGWGCGFSASDIAGKFGAAFGADTEAQARKQALEICRMDHRGCYIVACRSGVDTKEQAMALWPPKGGLVRCTGAGC